MQKTGSYSMLPPEKRKNFSPMTFLTPQKAAEQSITTYTSIAEDFSRTRETPWAEFSDLAKKTPNGASIADIGCGNGRLLSFFQKIKNPIHYTGIDPSDGLLKEAKKRFPEENYFFTGSFASIPLEEESQDEVWAIASFHHLATEKERRNALKNIRKVLKTNGRLVMTVWNLWEQSKYFPQKESARKRAFWNPYWNTRDFLIPFGKEKEMRYYYGFAKEELLEMLEEEGFTMEECFFSEGAKNLCITARKQQKDDYPVSFVHGIPFHIIAHSQVLRVFQSIKNINTPLTIFTPNPEILVEADKNEKFQKILRSANLSLPDGTGILWASGISVLRNKHRFWKWSVGIFSLFRFAIFRKSYPAKIKVPVCGSDVFRTVLEDFSDNSQFSKSIFLLGGAPGAAKYIAQNFSAIAGYDDGKVNTDRTGEILEKINASQASVLFVALGAPKQEFFIAENLKNLPHIRIAMGVGGSFDFISGHQKRAPQLFRKTGLEWLYRLIKEPARAQRIWNATGKFVGMMVR